MRIIVVAGGVISGIGKGIATASIGKILQQYGYSATAIKIDPYINCDAGTLRPTEHGEVWVTDDGGEIDQDLGNYERFLGFEIPKKNNITTGQVYKELIEKERRGEFLGQTVDVIPFVPNEVKRRIKDAGKNFDFVLVEIGGTVGDYQNMPFLFAAKSLEIEFGKENVAYILVSYLPVPDNIGEMKTKPTQHAIRMLTEEGIIPNIILCRSKHPLDEVRKKKIEVSANVNAGCIISAPDVDNIYKVPLNFEKEGFGKKLLEIFGLLPKKEPEWSEWETLVRNMDNPSKKINIAIVGKYLDIGDYCLQDSYISIKQALLHAGAALNAGISVSWVDAKSIEQHGCSQLQKYDGIIIPGGFGSSGVEGKMQAIKFLRENNIPFLGLCYGMQLAIVEYARNVCGLSTANTTEVDSQTAYPIIDVLASQKIILAQNRYGGSMRLGAYSAILKEGSQTLELYTRTSRLQQDLKRIDELKSNGESFRLGNIDGEHNVVLERHRHRFEVNPKFAKILEDAGMVFSGFHNREDGTKLMEFMELPNHKFFIGTQAHPEFKSRLGNPAPLFYGFVEACIKK